MNLDNRTQKVVEMYSKYPFPSEGNHGNYFERFVFPSFAQLQTEHPIHRLLEAGCGTGNVTSDIARLLPDVEVAGTDLTEESLKLAEQRATQLGLKNVSFRKTNLMERDPGLADYDFVYCQGVIHHLSDPLTGMKNLNRYLKKDHHAFVWLYSLLGRRRILELREALKVLGVDNLSWEQKLELAHEARPLFFGKKPTLVRKIIKVLERLDKHGQKEFLRFLYGHFTASPLAGYGDINTADQILHPLDKYYRFAEAVELFQQSGFEFVRVLEGMSNTTQESFGDDPILRHRPNLSRMESYLLIELHEQPDGVGYLIKKVRDV